jgi:hypothetical protein
MSRLLCLLTFLIFFISLSGCMPIGLPAMFVDVPALTYMSYGKNAFDIAAITKSGKTTGDYMFSSMTGLNCSFFGAANLKPDEYRFHQQQEAAAKRAMKSKWRGFCK